LRPGIGFNSKYFADEETMQQRILFRHVYLIIPMVVLVAILQLEISTVLIAQETKSKETATIKKIKSLLETQVRKWNENDLEGFMATYWKSDSLTFSSGGQTTRGWQATLDRYKKSYQSKGKEMGTLKFDPRKIEVTLLSDNAAMVLGNWHLELEKGDDREGNFSLVMKFIDSDWKIIHDHSSRLEKEE
jgi:ketosteroid isomerase-like protein